MIKTWLRELETCTLDRIECLFMYGEASPVSRIMCVIIVRFYPCESVQQSKVYTRIHNEHEKPTRIDEN